MGDYRAFVTANAQKPSYAIGGNLTNGSELVNHATRIGIQLRSSALMKNPPPSTRSMSRKGLTSAPGRMAREDIIPLSTWELPHTVYAPQFVQNIVVPLSAGIAENDAEPITNQYSLKGNPVAQYMSRDATGNQSAQRALAGRSARSTGGNKSARRTTGNLSARSMRSNVSWSTGIGKYMTRSTLPTERTVLALVNDQKNWNKSDQSLRFQHEQCRRTEGQMMKRMSEIKPHRIDRMYYMSGSKVGIDDKYDVDKDDLDRLKDMSTVRQKESHYGRGLSAEKQSIFQNTTDFQEFVLKTGLVPRQPPPSQMDGRVSEQEGRTQQLTIDGTNIILETSKPVSEVVVNTDAGDDVTESRRHKQTTHIQTFVTLPTDIEQQNNTDDPDKGQGHDQFKVNEGQQSQDRNELKTTEETTTTDKNVTENETNETRNESRTEIAKIETKDVNEENPETDNHGSSVIIEDQTKNENRNEEVTENENESTAVDGGEGDEV